MKQTISLDNDTSSDSDTESSTSALWKSMGLPNSFGKFGGASAPSKSIGRRRNEGNINQTKKDADSSHASIVNTFGSKKVLEKEHAFLQSKRTEGEEARPTVHNVNKSPMVPSTDTKIKNNTNASLEDYTTSKIAQESPKLSSHESKTSPNSSINFSKMPLASKSSHLLLPTIPYAFEVDIPAHKQRSIYALDVHPKASRMITGGMDSQVCLWDFNGMTTDCKSYRSVEPKEGHGIQSISISSSGSQFACASGEAICRLYDFEAKPIIETVKGDMYIRDATHTKGHTHMITECHYHPCERQLFLTSSYDATVRIWDVESKPHGVTQGLAHTHCLKAVDDRNLNSSSCHVSCCTWAPIDGSYILGGCADGSLQLWNAKRTYGKPDKVVRKAHQESLCQIGIFQDARRILTRATDGFLKLWDIRKLKESVLSASGISGLHFKAGFEISPDSSTIVVATQKDRTANSQASLRFYKADDLTLLKTVSFNDEEGALRVKWPAAINQIIVTLTNGKIKMLYDPQCSSKGALLFVNKQPATTRATADYFKAPVFTLDALPDGYKETRSGEIRKARPRGKEKELIERETMKTIVPPRPHEISAQEAQTGVSSSNIYHRFLGQIGQKVTQKEDPVEVLRAFATKIEKDGSSKGLISSAYSQTQPVNILDYSMKLDQEEELLSVTRKCPRCGLKMCQCGFMNDKEKFHKA